MPPLTPEEQLALLNYLGVGAYGSPLASSPNSQLNLVQDIGGMTSDVVFMYNMGVITPEQLLQSVRNATSEPVGEASDYDWESTYNSIVASGETDLINGADAIINGQQTAAQYIRGLISRLADEGAYELNPQLDAIVKSLETQLVEFENKYRNFEFVDEKKRTGEYFIDPNTGMLMKPVLGEDARANLRAMGWKGPLAEPDFWRTIPDAATMDQAAKLQEQYAPAFEAYDRDQELVSRGTREEIAKKSSSMKKLLEAKPETAQQVETTTRGWKDIEDAYAKAMADFKLPSNTRAMGYEDLGTISGKRYEIRQHDDGKFYLHWDEPNSSGATWNAKPLTQSEINSWRAKRQDRIDNPEKYTQRVQIGGRYTPGMDMYVTYTPDGRGGHTSTYDATIGGRTVSSTPLSSSQRPETSQEKASREYWARQAAYYTAKGMGEQRKDVKAKAAQGQQAVEAKAQEAMGKGTTPALEWLKMIPQLAAMASQPAPQQPGTRYSEPAPRVLSDEEINLMSNMIAGGMA